MLRVLISDTHYGWKQNSITWMNRQMSFIYDQLIPYIQTIRTDHPDEEIVLYHLGDVFDSRSSINPMVANKVREMFENLNRVVDKLFIIGGNHDYYSPDTDKDCAIDIVLNNTPVYLVTHNIYAYQDDLFIPWNEYENTDEIERWIQEHHIKRVFVHSDLPHIDDAHKQLFQSVQVFSGHIHTPGQQNNLHTLGSTYPLTFADSNSERGFYILDDQSNISFIPNRTSIKFWRFYNNEIFDIDVDSRDYIELYVDQTHMSDAQYTTQLSSLVKKYKEICIIPQIKAVDTDTEELETYDILDVCRSMIPEHLKQKFQLIEDQL